MKPVRVSIAVPQRREAVYDFLDVMANHERFTDHLMVDWRCSGPARGIGSRARVRVRANGRADEVDIEVIAAEAPATIVEQNVSAGGRRRATGTYLLEELPGGGTRVVFEYAWRQAPLGDRLTAPLVRAFLRGANERSLRRLAAELEAAEPGAGTAGRQVAGSSSPMPPERRAGTG